MSSYIHGNLYGGFSTESKVNEKLIKMCLTKTNNVDGKLSVRTGLVWGTAVVYGSFIKSSDLITCPAEL